MVGKVYIQNRGFEKFVEFISYVDHSEAIQKMVNSHFLLLVIPNTAKNKGDLPELETPIKLKLQNPRFLCIYFFYNNSELLIVNFEYCNFCRLCI